MSNDLSQALGLQSKACAHLGSPFHAELLNHAADDLEAGGALTTLLAPWMGYDLKAIIAAAVPLRLLGALHDLVLSGEAAALAATYPKPGETANAEAGKNVPAFLLLTRYSPVRVESGEMLSIGDVEEVLGLKAIGVIPESGDVLNASNKGEPVILDTESMAGQAYEDAVGRILGEERPMRFISVEKKGFFSKLFGG